MSGFDEVRLPTGIEKGAQGGPGFLTSIALLASGKEQRNSLWSNDRGKWDVGYGVQTREDALAIRNFFMARGGRARGFRFRDWTNYTTETTPAPIGTGNGSQTTFQLYYEYVDPGLFTYTKRIFKPVAADFLLYVNDTLVTSGYTLNAVTGEVTFTSPPANGAVITWLGKFDLPVRFDTDQLDMVLVSLNVVTIPSIPIVELKL